MKNRKRVFSFQFSVFRGENAFSLVELLVVMAIIGMMVGLSVLAVQGMRAPAVQFAAEQVMSGLSLARQVAITKNTDAAFLIADKITSGFPFNGPYRYWSVVYSNRGTGDWVIAKDWEELPNGAVFGQLLGSTYKTLNKNSYPLDPGAQITSAEFLTANNTFTIYKDTNNTASAIITTVAIPHIRFSSDGSASSSSKAIRILPGSVVSGNATFTSTNQYYFVETDASIGRIRMRSPESYRNP